jgi:hypothetical protein
MLTSIVHEGPGLILRGLGAVAQELPTMASGALVAVNDGLGAINDRLGELNDCPSAVTNSFAKALEGCDLKQFNLGTDFNRVNSAVDEPNGHMVRSAEDFFKERGGMAMSA